MPVLVGTSGWQYRDWRGRFYPPEVPQRLWLEHHAGAFSTTEVNNSFYRLPSREVFEAWAARTPPDYVLTVKASRFLSHVKRLREPEEPVARLMDRAAGLGDKIGAVLQRRPGVGRPGQRPRRPAVADGRLGLPARLHAGGGDAVWPYADAVLRDWAVRLAETWDDGETAYVYTNNDPGGAALRDAVTLAGLLREQGRTPSRVPVTDQVSGPLHEGRRRAAGPAEPAPLPGPA